MVIDISDYTTVPHVFLPAPIPPFPRFKVIRLKQSNDAYIRRKRDAQRDRITAAEKMVGKKLEVRFRLDCLQCTTDTLYACDASWFSRTLLLPLVQVKDYDV